MNLEKEIFDISLQDIIPNRFQPREIFNDNELAELSESIKQHGVIQPIIVRKVGDKYEIIAGERRFRASQMAGKETIPALVRDIDDREAAKIALLENLQRSNLTPIEEAKTYQTILKIDNITQDELAANLGKSQSTIANKLRLLTLNEEVQTALLNSQISERHARSLLGLTNEQQLELLHKTISEKLTVRQLDEAVMKMTGKVPENEMDNNFIPNSPESEISINNQIPINQNEQIMQNISVSEVETPNISLENSILNTTIPSINQNENTEIPTVNVPNIDIPIQPTNMQQENNPQLQNVEVQTNVANNSQSQIINIPSIDNNNNNNNNSANVSSESELSVQTEPQMIENESTNNDLPLQSEIQSSIEPASENQENKKEEEQPRAENIFDKLRVNREENQLENKFDLKMPDLSSVIIPQTESNNEQQENSYDNIYDLRFAINNFRQAIQNTEKFGFKVSTTEKELDDKYQIVIEIEKK